MKTARRNCDGWWWRCMKGRGVNSHALCVTNMATNIPTKTASLLQILSNAASKSIHPTNPWPQNDWPNYFAPNLTPFPFFWPSPQMGVQGYFPHCADDAILIRFHTTFFCKFCSALSPDIIENGHKRAGKQPPSPPHSYMNGGGCAGGVPWKQNYLTPCLLPPPIMLARLSQKSDVAGAAQVHSEGTASARGGFEGRKARFLPHTFPRGGNHHPFPRPPAYKMDIQSSAPAFRPSAKLHLLPRLCRPLTFFAASSFPPSLPPHSPSPPYDCRIFFHEKVLVK